MVFECPDRVCNLLKLFSAKFEHVALRRAPSAEVVASRSQRWKDRSAGNGLRDELNGETQAAQDPDLFQQLNLLSQVARLICPKRLRVLGCPFRFGLCVFRNGVS